VLECAFLINLIPLLSFTSHNAFGFVELSVILILYYFKHVPLWLKITAIAGMVLSGGNIYDVVGRKLWFVFDNASLVGIGGLVLCISSYSCAETDMLKAFGTVPRRSLF